jgi:hypothetical protein
MSLAISTERDFSSSASLASSPLEVEALENAAAGEAASAGPPAPQPSWRLERILEYACSRGLRPQVDAEAGVIEGVKILGLESRNGRSYRAAAVAAAAELYEGVKVNVNHQKGQAAGRDYRDRLGCLRNVRVAESGLFGDLHFNPHHPIARQLAWDAQFSPESVGLSHNVQAHTSRQDGRTIVEQILQVHSVDLVADPATTSSLFESEQAEGGERPSNLDAPADHGRQHAFTQQEVDRLLKEAGLPAEAVTAAFLEQLREINESTARKLIAERAKFHQSLAWARARPKSKGPSPETTGEVDIRRWARLIT